MVRSGCWLDQLNTNHILSNTYKNTNIKNLRLRLIIRLSQAKQYISNDQQFNNNSQTTRNSSLLASLAFKCSSKTVFLISDSFLPLSFPSMSSSFPSSSSSSPSLSFPLSSAIASMLLSFSQEECLSLSKPTPVSDPHLHQSW